MHAANGIKLGTPKTRGGDIAAYFQSLFDHDVPPFGFWVPGLDFICIM